MVISGTGIGLRELNKNKKAQKFWCPFLLLAVIGRIFFWGGGGWVGVGGVGGCAKGVGVRDGLGVVVVGGD